MRLSGPPEMLGRRLRLPVEPLQQSSDGTIRNAPKIGTRACLTHLLLPSVFLAGARIERKEKILVVL